jgi:hypothetical protein
MKSASGLSLMQRKLSDKFGVYSYTLMQYFTDPNAWLGGFYELAIELGPRSDERLLAALTAVWSNPNIDGVYLDNDTEPWQQTRQAITAESLRVGHLHGLARMPNGMTIACGTCLIREDDGPDWLVLYLPMGALGTAYSVGGYPFEPNAETSRPWREILDAWLARIGVAVYERVQYRLALAGWEVSGKAYADETRQTGIPTQRGMGYLWPDGDMVTFYPCTE